MAQYDHGSSPADQSTATERPVTTPVNPKLLARERQTTLASELTEMKDRFPKLAELFEKLAKFHAKFGEH